MRLFTSAAVSIAIALASGCASAPATQDPELGTVRIPLQQRGADGALYHLSAVFEIVGPGGTQIVDATDFQPSVTLSLPPGITTIEVLDGWTLERSTDNGATFSPVSALLGTLNPFALRVLANFSDTVVFEFLVRNPNGQVTITFGVDLNPRELAGGIIANTGTGDYAPYTRARMDYAIYHTAFVERITLPDGTKQLLFSSGAVAAEIFNDPTGLLRDTIAPAFAGGFLQYHIDAHPDGTQEITGELDGFNDPFPVLTFGPHVFQFNALPLDADGFPLDVFFNEANVPFLLSTTFETGDATLDGTLRFRSIPVSN
jgi:hypothetical protein